MFSRLANLIKGFFSLFISGVERRNPEALLELEQENLRKQVANFNQGLATHAGLCERIMGQVRKLEAEQKDLRAKTTAHLRAGNKSAAGQYALRLQTIDAQLEENRKQLEQAEATYQNLVKARDVAVQTARAKIEGLKGAINDMRMNQAMAEIHEMASGMISSIGGAGDTLNRLHEMVEEERTKAAGRARIAKDSVDMSGVEVKEAEMTALADQALADFAAREGISIPGEAPAPAPRSLGATRIGRARAAEMPAPQGAPAWATELALAYESGAHGQFILYGNVHDRVAVGGAPRQSRRLPGERSARRLQGRALVRPGQRPHDRARRRARREMGRREPEGVAARAAAGDSVHQPLPALSRQPARARPRGEGERRGDPARRRSRSCPPTARATSTAASPACCAIGPRKRRSASCRSPAS